MRGRDLGARSPGPVRCPRVWRSRASSSRTKRSNTAVRCSAGMPGPSSSTSSTTRPSSPRSARRISDCGVARRVVGQVAHQPLEPVAVARAPAPPRRRRCRSAGRSSLAAARLLEHEVVEVHGPACELQRPFVHPRQQQQVLDDPLEPHVLLEHDLGELVASSSDRDGQARPPRAGGSRRPGIAARARRPRRTGARARCLSRDARACGSSWTPAARSRPLPGGSGTRRWSSSTGDRFDLRADRVDGRERRGRHDTTSRSPRRREGAGSRRPEDRDRLRVVVDTVSRLRPTTTVTRSVRLVASSRDRQERAVLERHRFDDLGSRRAASTHERRAGRPSWRSTSRRSRRHPGPARTPRPDPRRRSAPRSPTDESCIGDRAPRGCQRAGPHVVAQRPLAATSPSRSHATTRA